MTLRVFLVCTSTTTNVEAELREAELKRMLQILRIKARIVVVPWDAVLIKQLPNGIEESRVNVMESAPQWPLKAIRPDYIQRFHIFRFITRLNSIRYVPSLIMKTIVFNSH
jgi:hypothetical protein